MNKKTLQQLDVVLQDNQMTTSHTSIEEVIDIIEMLTAKTKKEDFQSDSCVTFQEKIEKEKKKPLSDLQAQLLGCLDVLNCFFDLEEVSPEMDSQYSLEEFGNICHYVLNNIQKKIPLMAPIEEYIASLAAFYIRNRAFDTLPFQFEELLQILKQKEEKDRIELCIFGSLLVVKTIYEKNKDSKNKVYFFSNTKKIAAM